MARAVAGFDHVAVLHHDDLVGERADDAEVVGDEDVGEAVLRLQAAEELDDLHLHGHVEGGGRLVEDDELRLQDHGAGDGDALALAAGELVRVALGGGGVEADLVEDGGDAAGLVAEAVHGEALGDDLRDRHARGERAVGVLEDHLHVAAERAELGVLPALDVLAEEDDAALGRDEAHDGEREGGLAGAGLADDAEGLAGADGDGGVVHRLDVADGACAGGRA